MLQDEAAPYLNDHFKLRKYIGPSIGIGPSMAAKIMKENAYIGLNNKH